MKIQKILTAIMIILTINYTYFLNITYASNEETNQETELQEEFGINSFIKNSKKYTGEFFEDIDIEDILNSAKKGKVDNKIIFSKIFNRLIKETQIGIKSLAAILAIIIIHSILKAICDGLENNSISKLIYRFKQWYAIRNNLIVLAFTFNDIFVLLYKCLNWI